tara:strand:+ start:35 stop:466 length:432 start_codon:yes stop_codon:yes gene_type:complete
MGLYNEILKFGEYFNSVRMHEGLIVIDLKLPIDWKDVEVLRTRGNKVQIKVGSTNETHKIVSIFSSFEPQQADILVDEILAIIKWNKDQQEKNVLLNMKILELQKVFNENNVDSLRSLNIGFNEQQLNINEKEFINMAKKGDS